MSVAAAGARGGPAPAAWGVPQAEPFSTWLVGFMAWALIVLMIVPDNFDYGMLARDAPAAGSALSRTLWLLLLGIGLFVIASRAWLAWQMVKSLNPFLLAFAALAFASIAWSIDPTVTARRCIRVLTFLCDGFALVLVGWHPRRFQNVVRPAITFMLAASIAFGLAYPQLAIHHEISDELAGAWHGLANHKNTFGMLACMGVIFWFHAWLSGELGRWRALGGALIAGTCLVLSRSSTSIVVCMFALIFIVLLQRGPTLLRRALPYCIAAFALALLLYTLMMLRIVPGLEYLISPIWHLTGKDLSFTGRSDIWAVMTEHISYHKLLGTGLGAYWTGPIIGAQSYAHIELLHFYPGSAHNGYLDITNDLGFVGLACLLGFLVVHVWQSVRLAKFDHTQSTLLLALFLQQAVTNLSESHWLAVTSVAFVVMTFATTSLARGLLDERFRQYAAYAAMRQQPRHAHA